MSAILLDEPGTMWEGGGEGRRRTQADEIGAPMEDRLGPLECLFGHA